MYDFDNLYGKRKEILINSTSSTLQRFTLFESLPCFSQVEVNTALPGLLVSIFLIPNVYAVYSAPPF